MQLFTFRPKLAFPNPKKRESVSLTDSLFYLTRFTRTVRSAAPKGRRTDNPGANPGLIRRNRTPSPARGVARPKDRSHIPTLNGSVAPLRGFLIRAGSARR